MIKHIVFFQITDQAEGKTKAEIAQTFKEKLENLANLIPKLKKIEVGINHPETPATNYDVALYSEFDSVDDLNVYQVHPEHQKVVALIKPFIVGRACVDYEV